MNIEETLIESEAILIHFYILYSMHEIKVKYFHSIPWLEALQPNCSYIGQNGLLPIMSLGSILSVSCVLAKHPNIELEREKIINVMKPKMTLTPGTKKISKIKRR